MKFLCDNCKAKYQIADEKVAGRTLRMKCRKCGHSILIRGRHLRPSAAPGAPQSVSPGSLRREAARASAAPPPTAASVSDQWHVAINDVPVGPIRKDEIARKIAAGAVRADSLVWREGFDDWRPLRDVPELRRLLMPPAAPPARPPAPAPAARSSRPGGGTQRSERASNVVPIGGRMGGGAAVALDRGVQEPAEEPTVVASSPMVSPSVEPQPAPAESSDTQPSSLPAPVVTSAESSEPTAAPATFVPPPAESAPASTESSEPAAAPATFVPPPAEPSVSSPPPPRAARVAGMTPFAWMAIVGAGAFGATLAVVFALRFWREEPSPPPQAASPVAAAAAPPEPRLVEPPPEEDEATAPPSPDSQEAQESMAAAEQSARASKRPAKTASSGARRAKSSSDAKGGKLNAQAAARLARFAGPGSGGRSLPSRVGGLSGASRRSGGGKALEPQQLARVVNKNKSQLGACYNRAIRGMGEPPTVRVDVRIKVGASGAVTRVGVSSSNPLPGMEGCIRNTVRRWRFPPSGVGGEVKFPLVFQGG